MSKEQLISMAKENLAHAQAGTVSKADKIFRVPAAHYYDPQRWEREINGIFKRLPLMLATSSELATPGDYKALSAMGLPVLICRDQDGKVRAFENSCSHRGAQIMAEGRGNAKRFVCPYHAWSYDHNGALKHVLSKEDFGDIDFDSNGLITLPCVEKAGLIWVICDTHSTLNIEDFLCRYDELLDHFDLGNWHFFDSRVINGPNWKIAYDGYLDFYHLPILHRNTFGANISNKALYFNWGPHQHVSSPQTTLENLGDLDEGDWPVESLLAGIWTIFPHVSIASFEGVGDFAEGGYQGIMVSQLFPGDSAGKSYTVQNFLVNRPLSDEQAATATQQFEFLKDVVKDEDYALGIKQQQALCNGAREHVLFGRNEAGGQRFHQWVEKVLETPDDKLNELFV